MPIKTKIALSFVILAASLVSAQDSKLSLNAPAPIVDKKFVALTIAASGLAISDSYTTLFARENWLAGRTNVCNEEVESAWEYGKHPTVGRTYAVAGIKAGSSVLASYLLRKHHSKFWALPLAAVAGSSAQGVVQNIHTCK